MPRGDPEPLLPTSPGRPSGRHGRSILVVDDDVDAAEGLGILLEHRGFRVSVAFDTTSALTKMAVLRPDVIVADIDLPDMTGHELARRIRTESSDRPPLLLALSGHVDSDSVRRSRDAGFDHHCGKPIDADVVISIVTSLRHSGAA